MANCIISEFEELLKLKKFWKEYQTNKNMAQPFWNTYYIISDAINNEYNEDIRNKLIRWCDVTNYTYFKDVKPVKYYIQAKMLYRDGFYDSVIVMVRSICEMICYQILSEHNKDFSNEQNYNRFILKITMFPKTISIKEYTENSNSLINQIYVKDNQNNIKLNKNHLVRKVLTEYPKKEFEILMKQLDLDGFFNNNILSYKNYNILNSIYGKANTYVHKSSNNNLSLEKDARELIINIGNVLYEIYGSDNFDINTTISSAYNEFKDICNGINFSIDCYKTPQDAQLGYYNLPSQEQFNQLCSLEGTWNIKWKHHKILKNALIIFTVNKNDVFVNIKYSAQSNKIINPMDIKLYDNTIVLREFDNKNNLHDSTVHSFFKLNIFTKTILTGKTSTGEDVIATKVI